ncbi:MAG: YebC/PmpR family DNA-binding transcriptional regulator [Candidatus Nealsonbacteria bacterium]
MSGHSHWHSIKYKKGLADAKKSKSFSKITRELIITAREGGGDINFNPKLRMVIDKARSFNMPADNIERAIKKGAGELEEVNLQEITLEAYGPEGIAVIIEGITDNKNRSFGEIKQIINQNGGKLVNEGAVRWMFERKGVITVENPEINKEDLEMTAIEAGAEDVHWHSEENVLDIYTKPENIEKTKKYLEGKDIKISASSLDWVAKEKVKAKKKESCQKLFEALDENDAVQEIYSNLED